MTMAAIALKCLTMLFGGYLLLKSATPSPTKQQEVKRLVSFHLFVIFIIVLLTPAFLHFHIFREAANPSSCFFLSFFFINSFGVITVIFSGILMGLKLYRSAATVSASFIAFLFIRMTFGTF